jgi:hypothetical protein
MVFEWRWSFNAGFVSMKVHQLKAFQKAILPYKEYYYNENDEVSLDLEKERLSNAKKAAALLGEIWFDLWW